MTFKAKAIIAAIIIALALVGGYSFHNWRINQFIQGADAREQDRENQIRLKDDQNNQLRGENAQLRKDIDALDIKAKAQEQIITERGGSIVIEQKKLEAITERQKAEEIRINKPTDSCTRCKDLSVEGVKAGIFDKPLDCRERCK